MFFFEYKIHKCLYSQTTEILQIYISTVCRVADQFDVDPGQADADLDSAPSRSRAGPESWLGFNLGLK
jgi:hypothetical protein